MILSSTVSILFKKSTYRLHEDFETSYTLHFATILLFRLVKDFLSTLITKSRYCSNTDWAFAFHSPSVIIGKLICSHTIELKVEKSVSIFACMIESVGWGTLYNPFQLVLGSFSILSQEAPITFCTGIWFSILSLSMGSLRVDAISRFLLEVVVLFFLVPVYHSIFDRFLWA